MSEPIKLVKGQERQTVYAPRYAALLIAEQGWALEGEAPVVLPDVAAEEKAAAAAAEKRARQGPVRKTAKGK